MVVYRHSKLNNINLTETYNYNPKANFLGPIKTKSMVNLVKRTQSLT